MDPILSHESSLHSRPHCHTIHFNTSTITHCLQLSDQHSVSMVSSLPWVQHSWTTIYPNISSQGKSHHGTRHRWTKPLISVGHRHYAYVNNYMKTKIDQHATHTLKISSHSSTIATDKNKGMYVIDYSIEHIALSAECTLSTTIVILTL